LSGDGFYTPSTSLNGGPAGTGEVEMIGEVVPGEGKERNAGPCLCDYVNLGSKQGRGLYGFCPLFLPLCFYALGTVDSVS
jgi:hypothetical protein